MPLLTIQRTLALTVALIFGATACGSAEQSAVPVLEQIKSRNEAASRSVPIFETVAEAMPNFFYSIDGGAPTSPSDLYVVGRVEAVEEGRSFLWTETDEDEEIRVEVPFNDSEAMVSTIHVRVAVDRFLTDGGDDIRIGDAVTFGLALNGQIDIEAARSEIMAHPAVAVILYEPSPVFDYDESLWAVLQDGAFIGVVNDGGEVTFPALDADRQIVEGTDFIPSGLTVADLETPQETEPVRVTQLQGGWDRSSD